MQMNISKCEHCKLHASSHDTPISYDFNQIPLKNCDGNKLERKSDITLPTIKVVTREAAFARRMSQQNIPTEKLVISGMESPLHTLKSRSIKRHICIPLRKSLSSKVTTPKITLRVILSMPKTHRSYQMMSPIHLKKHLIEKIAKSSVLISANSSTQINKRQIVIPVINTIKKQIKLPDKPPLVKSNSNKYKHLTGKKLESLNPVLDKNRIGPWDNESLASDEHTHSHYTPCE